jgi:1-acyl-sn-glycerol-3-phosphate acyltransferase
MVLEHEQSKPLNRESRESGRADFGSGYALPALTNEVLERVEEGLEAGRNRAVHRSIQLALQRMEALLDGESDGRVSGWVRRGILRSLIHGLFKVHIDFPERIPTQPVILAANHLNHIDPFVILSEIPGDPYYYILGDARTLYNACWKRRLLNWSGGLIPLERRWKEEQAVIQAAQDGEKTLIELADAIEEHIPTGADIRTLRYIERVVQAILSNGDGIMLFPEGRLGSVEGQLHVPLKRGTVLYALRSGLPIVPVGLIGTSDLYFGKTLTIRFGEPLSWPQTSRPRRQIVEQALVDLQEAMINLLPQDYQDPPGPKPLRRLLNRMLW